MKYLFKPDEPYGFKGVLYELRGNKRKRLRRVDIEREVDVGVKVGVICQLVSDGGNLEDILGQDWAFTKYEFFNLLSDNPIWLGWYRSAQGVRNKMVVEETFKKLKEADLSGKEVEGFAKILRGISETIKRNEEEGGLKTVVNAYIHQPKAIKDRGWGL